MDGREEALVALGRALWNTGYRFTTVTPETHARVLNRESRAAASLRDVFGWNRPFPPSLLGAELLSLADRAGVLEPQGALLRARVRYSTLGDHVFVHSAFPTSAAESVFFGPDTYRFCAFLERRLGRCQRLVDVGCGSGAGGIVAARFADEVVLADVNPLALRFARVNAMLAALEPELVESDVLSAVSGPFDVVVANPPYLRDPEARLYREGGGRFGEALALRIAREALTRLPSGGQFVLYTGAPIVEGKDLVRCELERLCKLAAARLEYEEIDPDVFGAELDQTPYASVERIAAIGAVAVRG